MTTEPRDRLYVPLVGLLAFTSGGVDVVTLTRLGGAFTSVITGNLVVAGRGLGTTSLQPALSAVLAVAGYIAGVAAGSRLQRALAGPGPQAGWPRSATLVLAAECGILAAVNVAWIGWDAAPPAVAADVLVTAAGAALGVQGAATRAVTGSPSTTYMTGALTALVDALAAGNRRAEDATAAAGLLMLVAGAACSAALLRPAGPAALLPPLAALAAVVAVRLRQHRAERGEIIASAQPARP